MPRNYIWKVTVRKKARALGYILFAVRGPNKPEIAVSGVGLDITMEEI